MPRKSVFTHVKNMRKKQAEKRKQTEEGQKYGEIKRAKLSKEVEVTDPIEHLLDTLRDETDWEAEIERDPEEVVDKEVELRERKEQAEKELAELKRMEKRAEDEKRRNEEQEAAKNKSEDNIYKQEMRKAMKKAAARAAQKAVERIEREVEGTTKKNSNLTTDNVGGEQRITISPQDINNEIKIRCFREGPNVVIAWSEIKY